MSPSYQSETQSLKMKPRELPTIGPFRAIDILGQGAMGIVYLAEQTAPIRRRVALKVVRVGMDSKEVVARFERERQALALMDHANVARVFDAGESDDGRPYFAMEYVPGLPITKFCDQHKMPNRRRLELFAEVCDAVEHAHQKGVIHRDIKPSNVLVGGTAERPGPKVIDFGVAKSIGRLIVDDTFATQTGQFVGTPAYMSPEQAGFGHVEIDHRTDVYSLGMLLYEMLVGVLPFDFRDLLNKTLVQVQQFILDRDPMPPSTRLSKLGDEADAYAALRQTDRTHLLREIRGELDWILAKALEKDRNRRYRTVFDLATDVRHYLACEPLSVGPPTILYRAAKFVRRRQRAIAIYGLLATASLSAIAAGASILRSHELQKDAIRADFLEAEVAISRNNPQEAIDRLIQLVGAHRDHREAKVKLAYLLHRENQIAESIKVAEEVLAEDRSNGPAHLLLGMIHKHRDPDRAEQHFRRAGEALPDDRYYAALSLPASESAEAVFILTDLLHKEGTNFEARWSRAWRYFELGQYDRMLEDANFLIESDRNSATAWNARGVALGTLGRFSDAVDSFSQALEITASHAPTLLNRADAYFNLKKYSEALVDCQAAVKLEPNFAEAYAYRALAHQSMGKLQKASSDVERALAIQPRNAIAQRVRSRILRQQGDLVSALQAINEATKTNRCDANSLVDRGGILVALQEYDAAFADYSAACRLREIPEARHGRGAAALRLGAFDVALADFNRAIELDPEESGYFRSRARLYRWMGDYERALADNDRAIALAPHALDPHTSRGITRWLGGDILGAVQDFEKGLSIDPRSGAGQLLWLWQIHRTQGNTEAGSAALRKAAELISEPWGARLVALLQGTETPDQLLKLAVDDAKRSDAYYYLGAKAAADGQNEDARRWFQECVNLGYKRFPEYDLALGLLATLGH